MNDSSSSQRFLMPGSRYTRPKIITSLRTEECLFKETSRNPCIKDFLGGNCQTSHVPSCSHGKQSGAIESLSNKLVRRLGKRKRTFLLRCLHESKLRRNCHRRLNHMHVHQVFYVDFWLEDSLSDLREFESKLLSAILGVL